jgi:hypothetical protein
MKKNILNAFLFSLLFTGWAKAQEIKEVNPCNKVLAERLDFLFDGSLTNELQLQEELTALGPCGLDSFDLLYFSNMNALSAMVARISKEKNSEQITYGDLLNEINKVKQTNLYIEIKEITTKSNQLGATVGSIDNWANDRSIFEELGAATAVINEVENYLKNHPKNTKTYQQILEEIKKG